MNKDFDSWNIKKKSIHTSSDVIGMHEREIWWVSLGANIGVEIDGKQITFERPILVLRKFNNQMVWVLPITSQTKDSMFYHRFTFGSVDFFVALTQIRTISTKRFLRKIGMMSNEDFMSIQNKAVAFLLKRKDEDPQSGSSRRPKP